MTDWKACLTSSIFGVVYIALALGKAPGLRLDRPAIALIGAAAMIAFGAMDLREAAGSIDVDTIVLLLGMMILSGYLKLAGLYSLATDRIAALRPGTHAMLAAVVALSGVLSAFLVNDVVCVALTPPVISLCRRLRRPAVPYLVGLATASNVGSVATITGNPQNIIIGSLSGISYARFAARLAPIAVVGLILVFMVVAFVYRKPLREETISGRPGEEPTNQRIHRGLLIRSVLVATALIVAFFAGVPVATAALIAATFLMLDRLRPSRAFNEVDWPLLVMFMGLFAVVRAFEVNVVHHWDLSRIASAGSPVVPVSIASIFLSNLVSNVPAVLLFKPVLTAIQDQEQGWLALAMSSTLAGNLTLLGSVANLIVVEYARRDGEHLGFLEYLKVGVPLTAVTAAVGIAWLTMAHY